MFGVANDVCVASCAVTVVLFFGIAATSGIKIIHDGGNLFDADTVVSGLQVGDNVKKIR